VRSETADPGAREIERIREEYGSRARTIPADRYAWHRPENQYSQASIARVCTRLLEHGGAFPLARASIADIGCGHGQWLLEFLQWGARAANLHGIDILAERLAYAHERLPGASLHLGDARDLPWPDGSFDLVTQFLAFSSILDAEVQRDVAAEMLRVVRPGGHILWYDCRRSNPARAAVRGLDRNHVRRLFPSCSITFVDTTLAPPVSRLVARRSWAIASILESLPFACTHLAALITPGK
jgi:ubiquinone/menaquinone biosynthesis C-methylase UbiE